MLGCCGWKMATEGKRSKGRFQYLFDWNAKSRKKLFSNKSESFDAEGSSQGKENVENLAISHYLLRELSENGDRSSFRGSGNYSCVSSINGDDGYGTKVPGVVARLMGLDSMPTTNSSEAVEHHISHHGYSYSPRKVEGFPWNSVDSRMNKVHGRPIERFQTEVLPPKSAKPISITHHKLLSPIKSPGFIPTKDAAYIMEAAARIIDPAPQSSGRTKVPSLGSPSSSFKFHDLKDKYDAAQRSSRLPKSSKTPNLSAPVQQVRGTTSDRSSRRSLFKNIMSSQTSSSLKAKHKGKASPSVAQDKVKVQKKGGSGYSDSSSQQQKDCKKLKQKEPTQNTAPNKTPRKKSYGVLRQNNEKQNSISHKDHLVAKTSAPDQQRRKISPEDNCAGPSKIVSKVFVNAENRPKKVATTSLTDRRPTLNGASEKRPSLNRIKNISKSKPCAAKDNRLAEEVQENSDDRLVRRDLSLQGNSRKDMDVISFTFTSPIKKAGSKSSSTSTEACRSNCHNLCADSCDNVQSDTSSPPRGFNLIESGNGQPSSPQSQEVTSCISSESVHRREDESDFTDASYWELEYVRHMLHYAGLGRLRFDEDCQNIDPGLFDLLENLINSSGRNAEPCSKLERKILFDCVTESVDAKYQRAFLGSYKSWTKWGMLLQNEWLTEEVYKEIICWQNMGSLMVDELVDRDMSTQYGRWLDFEIESLEEGMDVEEEILASLVDELVGDLIV
ncbi:Protein LONGIFOLIA 2 [Bienertia sinuspersici]